MPKNEPALIVDGNLLARKMFYKFRNLSTNILPGNLAKIHSGLADKYKKRKKVRPAKFIHPETGRPLEMPPGIIEDKLKKIITLNKEIPVPTGVTFGILRTLLRIYETYSVGKIIFCYDPLARSRESQRRLKLYPKYKGSRIKEKETEKKMKENADFYEQLALAHYLIYIMGIPQVWTKTLEADDLLHHFSKKFKESLLLTNDHDLFQALSPKASMLLLGKTNRKELYTLPDFIAEFKISPKRYTDAMSLSGCKGDDVPGIKGISEEIAISLMEQFGSLKNLVAKIRAKEDLSELIPPKVLTSLLDDYNKGFKEIKRTRKLIKLYGDDPIIEKESIVRKKEYDEIEEAIANTEEFLRILKFNSFFKEDKLLKIKEIIDKNSNFNIKSLY